MLRGKVSKARINAILEHLAGQYAAGGLRAVDRASRRHAELSARIIARKLHSAFRRAKKCAQLSVRLTILLTPLDETVRGIPCRYLPVHAKIAQANHRLPAPSTNEQSDEILTNEEVVAYLKAGRRTVYRLVANGQIPAFHWAAHGASAVPNWTGGQLPVSARRTSTRRTRGSHERHLRIICWRRKVSCARQARTAGRGDRRASDQADSTGVQRHRSPGGSH